MKFSNLPLAFIPLFFAFCPFSRADITITPTFSPSIADSGNAAKIESAIDDAISTFESDIATPINVSIDFQAVSSGLGASNTAQGNLAYSAYLTYLEDASDKSASDKTALASLPKSLNTGINHNSDVTLSSALFAALGDTSEASTLESQNNGFDGVIYLNIGSMNLSRSGPQNPNKYDLESVASHEIDEVLGIGGPGSALYQGGSAIPSTLPSDGIGVTDLFRYRGPRQRSFTYNPFAPAYFSINGGRTDLTNFNQFGEDGADFGDWAGDATPQVQDAYGTPGTEPDLGVNELTALDVVGYTLTTPVAATADLAQDSFVTQSVPEPQAIPAFLLACAVIAAWRARSRTACWASLLRRLPVPVVDHLHPFHRHQPPVDHPIQHWQECRQLLLRIHHLDHHRQVHREPQYLRRMHKA